MLASAEAVSTGSTKYSPNDGLLSLRTEIAARYSRSGIPTTIDQIVVTTGSTLSLFSVLACSLQSGDECLVPFPGFPNYHQIIHLMNATPVPYTTDRVSGYCPTVDQIAQLITPKTKCLLLCNPGNPTGVSFSRDLVEQLVKLTREKNILLISDEIYSDLTFDGPHTCAADFETKYTPVGAESHIAVISGVSKSFAMTGFRIGWTRCSPELKDCITKIQEPIVSCSTAFAQVGAAAALKNSEYYMNSMVVEYKKRRDTALQILASRGRPSDFIPGGAFYLPLDISHTGMGSYEFAMKLLMEKSVAVAPGTAFDTAQILPCRSSIDGVTKKSEKQRMEESRILNEFVRISFANTLENVSSGIHRICDLMDEMEIEKKKNLK